MMQDLAALGRRRALVAANFCELGRGRVGDLVFVEDRGRDLLLQKAVRVQGEEELVDDRPLLVLLIIILHAAHIREKPRDVEKLPRVELVKAVNAFFPFKITVLLTDAICFTALLFNSVFYCFSKISNPFWPIHTHIFHI